MNEHVHDPVPFVSVLSSQASLLVRRLEGTYSVLESFQSLEHALMSKTCRVETNNRVTSFDR